MIQELAGAVLETIAGTLSYLNECLLQDLQVIKQQLLDTPFGVFQPAADIKVCPFEQPPVSTTWGGVRHWQDCLVCILHSQCWTSF